MGIMRPNAHDNFNGEHRRWAVACELIRRGGHKKGKLIGADEAKRMAHHIGKQNQRGGG